VFRYSDLCAVLPVLDRGRIVLAHWVPARAVFVCLSP
jgi:hypothetical protein